MMSALWSAAILLAACSARLKTKNRSTKSVVSFYEVQNGLGMARRFHFAVCGDQPALFVNHESAALNTHKFFAVHVFLFNHAKELTQFFIFVRQEVKLKIIFVP